MKFTFEGTCSICGCSFSDTGRFIETTDGTYVECKKCETIYAPEYAVDKGQKRKIFLVPVKTKVEKKDHELTTEQLKEIIANCTSATDFLEAINQ